MTVSGGLSMRGLPALPRGLTDLPPEILLVIFGHLRPKHAIKDVRLVCRLFYRLISNDRWWMCRIQRELAGGQLPNSELNDESFDPARTMDALYTEKERWSLWAQEQKSVADGAGCHYATVDAVKLFRGSNGARLCLTGGRDRALKLWSLDKMKESPSDKSSWLLFEESKAHDGWIWAGDIAGCADRLLSCSWDGSIKLWSLDDHRFTATSSASLEGAVTSLLASRSQAICSTFRSRVSVLDLADNLKVVQSYKFHRGSVFSIAKKDTLVYSYGEDRHIRVADLRCLKAPVLSTAVDAYGVNMCLSSGLVYLATAKGAVLTFCADDLTLSHSFDGAPEGEAVRQVIKTDGSVLALTQRSGLKAFSLASTPVELACSGRFDCEPCRFDHLDGDIAVGCGDGSVIFWHRPDFFAQM